jgi:ABC-type multidrug transport system fused ATPase/permease subunit
VLDDLRGHVALVTQEHHVFVGTVEDNVRLARPGASARGAAGPLEAVDALTWVEALPEGCGHPGRPGRARLSPAQAQQVALARLVLADPHTLVLDEATSLLDPRAARHLERSLAAVLDGRTVVAIAHRLHTAHDADRVAVVDGGRGHRDRDATTSWSRPTARTRRCGGPGATTPPSPLPPPLAA